MSAVKKDELTARDHRLSISEHKQHQYFYVAETGTTREDLTKDMFWKHIAQKFQMYTKIDVVTDDGAFYAELLVIGCGQNWAKVEEKSFLDLRKNESMEVTDEKKSEYEVRHNGPHDMWCIFRKSDNGKIVKHIRTKEQAQLQMREYLKVIK